MSQISKPMQIALAAVVVFAIAWFAFLRPSDDSETATQTETTAQAPGVTGLTNAVKKAEVAKTASEARNKKAEESSGEQTTASSTSTTQSTTASSGSSSNKSVTPAGPAIKDPARDSGDPADGVLDQLKGKRVAIVLFTGDGADDRTATAAVRAVGRENKNVIVRVTSIRNVGKYASITDKLNINQAPSTVIIGSDMVAQVLTGIIDAKVVRQYVGDARRRAAKAD